MNNKIIIINGPNLNLLGEREQSQYGSISFEKVKENCIIKSKELDINLEFKQSNVEGELVDLIQNSRKNFDGMIINAAAFTHTSVAIRDALEIFKKMKIDKKIIKELSDYLEEFNLTELEYTEKDTKIKVSKNNISIGNQSNQTSDVNNKITKSTIEPSNIKSGMEVTSPIIGTAYHAPEPGAKKFVEIGKKIKKGDTVMIVEAMKTMNHVPSTVDGTVKEICVEDGQPVEFGQTIIVLE